MGKDTDEMSSRAVQHICITGACGAGKSTLAQALSHQWQLPLHRLDDDPAFRQMLPDEPWLPRVTDPQRYARWQALRRQVVQEAVTLPQPHIIEGTHILTALACTSGHRRILVDTPFHQMIRQSLARDRAKYAEDPTWYAARDAGVPGSAVARQRAGRARQIYDSLRPDLEAFRHLPGVDMVPSRALTAWLAKRGQTSADLPGAVRRPSRAPEAAVPDGIAR